jgi:hypothetical protein
MRCRLSTCVYSVSFPAKCYSSFPNCLPSDPAAWPLFLPYHSTSFSSQLDYGYLNSCSDTRELKRIQAALESGDYGLYPPLEKLVHERLMAHLPPKERSAYLAQRGILPEGAEAAAHALAEKYAAELKSSEAGVPQAHVKRVLPPVRGAPAGSGQLGSSRVDRPVEPRPSAAQSGGVHSSASALEIESPGDALSGAPRKGGKKEFKAAPLGSQYKQWEKFDVDAALQEADKKLAEEVRRRAPPLSPPPSPSNLPSTRARKKYLTRTQHPQHTRHAPFSARAPHTQNNNNNTQQQHTTHNTGRCAGCSAGGHSPRGGCGARSAHGSAGQAGPAKVL